MALLTERAALPAGADLAAPLAALALACVAILCPRAAHAEGPAEYEVKAAFLLNFARLVEWPATAFDDPSSPLEITALAPEALFRDLERLLQGKRVGERPVRIRRVDSARDLAGAHVVFLSAASPEDLAAVLERTGGGHALVVSERSDAARRGASINFFREGHRIRFEINPEAAARAGLKVSSRLLRVAVLVEGRSS